MATNPKHRTRAASQGPVFSRLQNLFPPNTSQPPPSHALRPRLAPEKIAVSPQSKPVHHTRKAFKVRILTWNMHDSVPKGDLEELFGKVPLWSSNAAGPDVAGSIPVFPLEADHPYHLVVV
ncbi:hypothetical protein DXG03_003729 [Asterophora parasitica]|uniref:Uncharacterized protein n=1 Tax=Asterophora parasitica TaxID=117018 RepID=A0A9P7K9B7_9AGAR|nr:hypothetical protein DXG03_003729 [Asterophora parasitica]